jgi:hypothetical protein
VQKLGMAAIRTVAGLLVRGTAASGQRKGAPLTGMCGRAALLPRGRRTAIPPPARSDWAERVRPKAAEHCDGRYRLA